MGGKYTKPSRQSMRGTSTFSCFSRPGVTGKMVRMRQSASCDANITFMSRFRTRLIGVPRPKSALMNFEDRMVEQVVPRSTTDQNLLTIEDNDQQEVLLNDVREKLIAIKENNRDDDDEGSYDDDEWEKGAVKGVGGFERFGQFAKSPAIYNFKDVANDDDQDLELSLSPNSTLSYAEASVSSSLTTTPPPIATLPPPPAPPRPPPDHPPAPPPRPPRHHKISLLDRLTRTFRHRLRSKSARLQPTTATLPPLTTMGSSKKTTPSSTRLSLSDGLIYIDDDPTLACNDVKLPRFYYHQRRSYFIEMERTSIAMEQRCLRDNDTLSLNTISYVVAQAPLAQSENTTLASSREQLVPAASRRRTRQSSFSSFSP